MSSTPILNYGKKFQSEKEKSRFYYKVRQGKIDIKNKGRQICSRRFVQSKKYRIITRSDKLSRTIIKSINISQNCYILDKFFSYSKDKTINEVMNYHINRIVKDTQGKTYFKREKFVLDKTIKRQILLDYLIKNVHICSLKSLIDRKEIRYDRVKLLKIRGNKKNNRIYESFLEKYKKLKLMYEQNNCFYLSYYDEERWGSLLMNRV